MANAVLAGSFPRAPASGRALDASVARKLLDVSGRRIVNLEPGESDLSGPAPGVCFERFEDPEGVERRFQGQGDRVVVTG